VYFTLENKLPVFNAVAPTDFYETVNSVYAESCNPPLALGAGRGSYFNGKDAVVSLHNFVPSDTFSIEMWVKAEIGGGTLAIFDSYIFPGWTAYDPDCECTDEDPIGDLVSCGKLEFWISDCYTPVLTFHDFDMQDERVNYGVDMSHGLARVDRGWSRVGFSIMCYYYGSEVIFYSNDMMIHNEDMNYTIFKAIGDDFKYSLGSFHGEAYFLQGFIFDFKYAAEFIAHLDKPESNFFNQDGFSYPGDGKDCDWNQYLDAEGECEECDATCTSGCTNGEVCYECHSTCRTCTGHKVDDCIDCWCGAEVDGDGCCQCDGSDGYTKDGAKCK